MKKYAAIAGLICSMTLPAGAYLPGTSTLSIQGGFSGTNNNVSWSSLGPGFHDERVADAGGAVGGQYFFYPAAPLGLGLDLNYSALREHSATDVFSDANANSKFRPTTYLAMVKFSRPWGIVRPYLFGGLGGHTTNLSLSLTPLNGSATKQIIDQTSSGFASAFGVGLDIFVAPAVFVGGEYRFTYLGSSTYRVTSVGSSLGYSDAKTDLSLSSFFVRIGMRFGGIGEAPSRSSGY